MPLAFTQENFLVEMNKNKNNVQCLIIFITSILSSYCWLVRVIYFMQTGYSDTFLRGSGEKIKILC